MSEKFLPVAVSQMSTQIDRVACPDGFADGKASVSGLSSAAGASCRKGDG